MNKTNLLLSLLVIALFYLYLPINRAYGEVISFRSFVDSWIPLSTFFVIPYISYFIFLIFSWAFFIKYKFFLLLSQTLIAVIISTIFAYIFYFVFQNSVDRPVIESKNIFDSIYLGINSQVPPYNAFPSLHVAISAICLLAYRQLKAKIYPWMVVWVFLIIISTVLTKQHYFLDIIGGLILALVSFKTAKHILEIQLKHNSQ